MWNRDLYIRALNQIKKEGSFNGVHIKSKEDIYRQLSETMNLSFDTVKGWSRSTSNGPGSIDDVKKLESLLGFSTLALYQKEPVTGEITNVSSDRKERNIMVSELQRIAL